jgi:hypothetical protein
MLDAIASGAAFIGSSGSVPLRVHEATGRRKKEVVGQFRELVGGSAMTLCFAPGAALVPLLPVSGRSAASVGRVAPYRARAMGRARYYAAGFTMLWIAGGPAPMTGWWVGGTFGAGQLFAAPSGGTWNGRKDPAEKTPAATNRTLRLRGLDRVLHEERASES